MFRFREATPAPDDFSRAPTRQNTPAPDDMSRAPTRHTTPAPERARTVEDLMPPDRPLERVRRIEDFMPRPAPIVLPERRETPGVEAPTRTAEPEPVRPTRKPTPVRPARRGVCKANYAALDDSGIGCIVRPGGGYGLQTLVLHRRSGVSLRQGDTLSFKGRPVRVQWTTRHRYYSPGDKVTTQLIGVAQSDWDDLLRAIPNAARRGI